MRTRLTAVGCSLFTALTLVACSVTPGDEPTKPPPVEVFVPHLVGMPEARALSVLEQENLQGLVIERKPSTVRPGEILWQRPKTRGTVLEGAVVHLVVAKAPPRVPRVTGMSPARAKHTLLASGYRVRVEQRVTPWPTGRLFDQRPDGRLMPGSTVTLLIDRGKPPPPACGYLPCLPPASDYDCVGGSGDGPAYTGTVEVIGVDEYGLDADGDGWGCE